LREKFGNPIRPAGWEDLPQLLAQSQLLANGTSLGMTGKPPLALDIAPLKRSAVVYDVVYVPLETGLLAAARLRGHRVVDGLGMLLQQAGFGFQKWFGVMPRVTPELRALVEADIRAKTGQ
jgi:shikimate dehydrogenase